MKKLYEIFFWLLVTLYSPILLIIFSTYFMFDTYIVIDKVIDSKIGKTFFFPLDYTYKKYNGYE